MPGKARLLLTLLIVCALPGCGSEEDEAPVLSAAQLQQLQIRSESYSGLSVAQLQTNAEAQTLAQELFAAHCASCHGKDGKGGSTLNKAQNLTGVFNYGSSEDAIRTTITQGRHSLMPALGATLGEVELGAMVAYVRGISSGEAPGTFDATAKAQFAEFCVQCHGPDARGNPAIGSADLTDGYWQHGNSMMNVRLTITRGVEAQCPAQAGVLTATEIELLISRVLQMRN